MFGTASPELPPLATAGGAAAGVDAARGPAAAEPAVDDGPSGGEGGGGRWYYRSDGGDCDDNGLSASFDDPDPASEPPPAVPDDGASSSSSSASALAEEVTALRDRIEALERENERLRRVSFENGRPRDDWREGSVASSSSLFGGGAFGSRGTRRSGGGGGFFVYDDDDARAVDPPPPAFDRRGAMRKSDSNGSLRNSNRLSSRSLGKPRRCLMRDDSTSSGFGSTGGRTRQRRSTASRRNSLGSVATAGRFGSVCGVFGDSDDDFEGGEGGGRDGGVALVTSAVAPQRLRIVPVPPTIRGGGGMPRQSSYTYVYGNDDSQGADPTAPLPQRSTTTGESQCEGPSRVPAVPPGFGRSVCGSSRSSGLGSSGGASREKKSTTAAAAATALVGAKNKIVSQRDLWEGQRLKTQRRGSLSSTAAIFVHPARRRGSLGSVSRRGSLCSSISSNEDYHDRIGPGPPSDGEYGYEDEDANGLCSERRQPQQQSQGGARSRARHGHAHRPAPDDPNLPSTDLAAVRMLLLHENFGEARTGQPPADEATPAPCISKRPAAKESGSTERSAEGDRNDLRGPPPPTPLPPKMQRLASARGVRCDALDAAPPPPAAAPAPAAISMSSSSSASSSFRQFALLSANPRSFPSSSASSSSGGGPVPENDALADRGLRYLDAFRLPLSSAEVLDSFPGAAEAASATTAGRSGSGRPPGGGGGGGAAESFDPNALCLFCFPDGVGVRVIPRAAMEGAERLGWVGPGADRHHFLAFTNEYGETSHGVAIVVREELLASDWDPNAPLATVGELRERRRATAVLLRWWRRRRRPPRRPPPPDGGAPRGGGGPAVPKERRRSSYAAPPSSPGGLGTEPSVRGRRERRSHSFDEALPDADLLGTSRGKSPRRRMGSMGMGSSKKVKRKVKKKMKKVLRGGGSKKSGKHDVGARAGEKDARQDADPSPLMNSFNASNASADECGASSTDVDEGLSSDAIETQEARQAKRNKKHLRRQTTAAAQKIGIQRRSSAECSGNGLKSTIDGRGTRCRPSDWARKRGAESYEAMLEAEKLGDACLVEKCYVLIGCQPKEEVLVLAALQQLVDSEREANLLWIASALSLPRNTESRAGKHQKALRRYCRSQTSRRHHTLAVIQAKMCLSPGQASVTFPSSQLEHIRGKQQFFETALPISDAPLLRLPLPLPRLDKHWGLAKLLLTIGPDSLLLALQLLLLERSVLVLGESLAEVTACCFALRELIKPFSWSSTFSPVLPFSMLDFLNSPVPFIAGMAVEGPSMVSTVENDERTMDAMASGMSLLNLSMGTLLITSEKGTANMLNLCPHLRERLGFLSNRLQMHAEDPLSAIFSLSKFIKHGLSRKETITLQTICSVTEAHFKKHAGDLARHGNAWKHYGTNHAAHESFVFYPEWFLSPLHSELRFQEALVRTQLFVGYVNERKRAQLDADKLQKGDVGKYIAGWIYDKMIARRSRPLCQIGQL